jgi:hypothetical protein
VGCHAYASVDWVFVARVCGLVSRLSPAAFFLQLPFITWHFILVLFLWKLACSIMCTRCACSVDDVVPVLSTLHQLVDLSISVSLDDEDRLKELLPGLLRYATTSVVGDGAWVGIFFISVTVL